MRTEIAMVMYDGPPAVSLPEVSRFMAEHWPELPQPGSLEKGKQTILFRLGADEFMIGTMPAPIPWSELQEPCAASYLWPQATEALRPHRAHVIISVKSELPPLPLYALLTKVTASVLATSPAALGVYWGHAAMVVPKDLFIEFAVKVMPLQPPVWIWVDFRALRDNNQKVACFTNGMTSLGHMEFEAQSWPETVGEIRERLGSLAAYVLKNGPVIRDGDTVGRDADEKIKVVYSSSLFGHYGKVMRLVTA